MLPVSVCYHRAVIEKEGSLEVDSRHWWCPACMRTHGLGEVLPFQQNGVEEYTCRETGAILQSVPVPTAPTATSPGDEQRYWCPACMRSHTLAEVTPFTHGSDHGLACRLTGAVVEALDVPPSADTAPVLVAKDAKQESEPTAARAPVNDPNVQTATEMTQMNAGPAPDTDDHPISLDAPADDTDPG